MATVVRLIGAAAPTRRRAADVVVIGGGAAGMVAALVAAQAGRQVDLVTKTSLGEGSSRWAQGGIAAAVGPSDTPAAHAADTVVAGAGLCDIAVVDDLTASAGAVVERLETWGARFDAVAGQLTLGREGGHGKARIVHAGGDATGAEVVRALRDQLADGPVGVEERCVALDLVTGPTGAVAGVVVAYLDPVGAVREVVEIAADAVVLATGGLGQAYATTSNPAEATGDGLALAARAGATLRHLEFVQFHPTVLFEPGATGQRPLLTEALRGAGAVVRDAAGRSVLAGVHPLADLAPRDVVAGAMARRLAETGDATLFLDCRSVEDLAARFPTVVGACRAAGFDPVREPVPVRPAAHYACGGVAADLDGRTSIAGLLAIGEVAATGAHGANRLASNSLLEAVVAGARAGALLGAGRDGAGRDGAGRGRGGAGSEGGAEEAGEIVQAGEIVDPGSRPGTARATEDGAGVLRSAAGLEGLLADLAAVPRRSGDVSDLATIEATNLHTVSTLVASAACARRESRGCHQRVDAPVGDTERAVVEVRVGTGGAVVAVVTPVPGGHDGGSAGGAARTASVGAGR